MVIKKKYELDITLLLGNFHGQMSFLGSIGYVMKNTGIKSALSTTYGGNTVDKMLQGGQYERAMRGHDVLSTALMRIILSQISNSSFELFLNLKKLFNKYLSSEETNLNSSESCILEIQREILKLRNDLIVW